MGKSGRAKKAKRADFQKKKIKVGKTLKKAQNETKTDFKARKIILKEQLATKSTETLVTKKHHDIKELLSRLNYHNVYVRQDGVDGLRELVSKYEPATLLPHLSTFITRGAPCILDSDLLIRRSATKFLEALIAKMGDSIEPYFHLLATHLSCAMVHLNVGVQSDSLELMKILIRHTPNLVARHANTVLTNFINLIARKVVTGKDTSVQKEVVKAKVVKPKVKFSFANFQQPTVVKNRLAGHSGRLSLLNELSNFLGAVLAEQGHVQNEVPLTTWETVAVGSAPPIMWCNTESKAEELWLFTDVQRLKEFTNTVVKLLVELWLEVDSGSEVDISVGGNALNEEGVDILSCIVSITMHIWHITEICTQQHPKKCQWLQKHFASNFMKRIMGGFPFCCHLSPHQGKKRKKNKEAEQVLLQKQVKQKLKHCDDLNILLALFGTEMSFASHREKSVNYLSQLLRDGNRDGQYSMSTAVRIIKELLPLAAKSEIQTIVISAHTCFKRFHPLKKDRAFLLELLLEATDYDHGYMLSNPCVDAWVKDIVKDLTSGQVREPLLNAAIQLRLRNNTGIKQLLINDSDRIRETIKTNGIQGLTSEEIERKLIFLLKE